METITLEYDVRNEIATDLINVLAKMSGVKILEQKKSVALEREKKYERLMELAKELDASMNHDAPKMTMEEIVQEVRDYRNGK